MSKMIPKNVLEDIRNANDVVEVIGSYLQIKRAGSAFKALCPFHKEKTPSFHVNPQRQIYHCFGCGVGGDVFKFVMAYEGVDFSTAARMLAQRAGIRVEWEDSGPRDGPDKDLLFKLHEDLAQLYHRALLESPAAEKARQYLRERELDEQTVKDFLIGFAPDRRGALIEWAKKKKYSAQALAAAGVLLRSEEGGEYYDRFRNRLMFPIRDELGRVIAFSGRILEKDAKLAKYVNSPETPLFRKGRVLYALDKARRAILDSKIAILCEGQIDVIRCHVAGVNTAVASQGTALTEDHARLLKRYADAVVVVLDSDKAGQDASIRSAEVLLGGGLSVSIAALPKGEDPDSLIRQHGPEAFRKVVESARSVLTFQIEILRSREDLSQEASLMRAARAVLETIGRAPTAVQRDQLLQQAARELKISADALRQDLRRVTKTRERPTPEDRAGPAKPMPHPIEEVTLAEKLAAHPEVRDTIAAHLPPDLLTDAHCRTIIRLLLERPDDERWTLASELTDEDEECQRLAAQIESAPLKLTGEEASPIQAAQDLILVIRRKALERRREELRRALAAADAAEKERIRVESSQISVDINTLKQGWEKALPILELERHGE